MFPRKLLLCLLPIGVLIPPFARSLEVDDATLQLPVPAGLVELGTSVPALREKLKTTMPEGGRLLKLYLLPADLAATATRPLALERYAAVQTSASSDDARMAPADFAALAADLRQRHAEVVEEFAAAAAPLVATGAGMVSANSLGVFLDREDAIGMLLRMAGSLSAPSATLEMPAAAAWTVVRADDRLLVFHAFAEDAPEDLAWLRNTSEAWTAETIRLNPNRIEPPPPPIAEPALPGWWRARALWIVIILVPAVLIGGRLLRRR